MAEDFSEINLRDATPEMLLKVKVQIEKDLALSSFTYSIEQPDNLQQLVPELHNKIAELKEKNSADIMKIVYRVDLTEKQYKKVAAMEGDWAQNLAKAIVLREFQKIIIRSKY